MPALLTRAALLLAFLIPAGAAAERAPYWLVPGGGYALLGQYARALTTGIVVISQLVAFLSYQIRVVAGLRVLNARPA